VVAKKVKGAGTVKERKSMIERDSHQLSIRRQCELADVNRNRLNPPPDNPGARELELCRLIDEIHMKAPAFGSRKIRDLLRVEYGKQTTRGRVRHLMRKMGIKVIYRAPRTSLPGKGSEHKVHPYLLRDRKVETPDEVWCTAITYIPMERGHAYLVAIMDWHTRAGGGPGSGDLQYRPRLPVHLARLAGAPYGLGHPDQHGRQGPLARQRVHRKTVEHAQMRRTPPAGIRHPARTRGYFGKLV
jgi:hypothetical protein